MSEITIEAIVAEQSRLSTEQARLAKMIADFKAQAPTVGYHAVIPLRAGEHYAGLIIGKDGEPSYHLVLLDGQANGVNWKAATEWAASQGGELPTRREQALLYANLKEQFEPEWYWSAQEYESDPAYAWCQSFYSGVQDDCIKCHHQHARAVRRLPI